MSEAKNASKAIATSGANRSRRVGTPLLCTALCSEALLAVPASQLLGQRATESHRPAHPRVPMLLKVSSQNRTSSRVRRKAGQFILLAVRCCLCEAAANSSLKHGQPTLWLNCACRLFLAVLTLVVREMFLPALKSVPWHCVGRSSLSIYRGWRSRCGRCGLQEPRCQGGTRCQSEASQSGLAALRLWIDHTRTVLASKKFLWCFSR